MSSEPFHKKRVTRCGNSEGNLLDRFTQLAIENNAIDDYAEGITDKEYLEMEQLEKQINSALKLQKLIKKELESPLPDYDKSPELTTKEDYLKAIIGSLVYQSEQKTSGGNSSS